MDDTILFDVIARTNKVYRNKHYAEHYIY